MHCDQRNLIRYKNGTQETVLQEDVQRGDRISLIYYKNGVTSVSKPMYVTAIREAFEGIFDLEIYGEYECELAGVGTC